MFRGKTLATNFLRSMLPSCRMASQSSEATSGNNPVPYRTPNDTEPYVCKADYIDDRLNRVFNIILADIHISQELKRPNPYYYKDPYNSKDQILQDLVADKAVNRDFNFHDLIEDEFQLEISDRDFSGFKTLKDVVDYVNCRWEVQHHLNDLHLSPNITY